MEYIQLDPGSGSTKCNPTKQQKSIYDFYESRHSVGADDIYSSEWYHRTMEFTQQSSVSKADAPILLSSWDMIEDLEFGSLFLSHPIAAYAFWQMLHAFYSFDRIVCGHAERGMQKVESWKRLKPFVYLKSRKIRNEWRKSLNVLKHEIECEILEGEELLLRLQDLLGGLSGLENALRELEENFAVNLRGMMFVDVMLEKTALAVDERRNMIANLLRLEDNNATFGMDSDESRSGTFGESFFEVSAPSSKSEKSSGKNSLAASREFVLTQINSIEDSSDTQDSQSRMLLNMFFVLSILFSVFLMFSRKDDDTHMFKM